MSGIRIITDSTADLPLDLIKKYNITVVPLRVHFQDETYREGIDLSPVEFNKKLKASENLPTTSQPSPGEFVKAYESLALEGAQEIISIHLSKKFSGTYQSAFLAKTMIENEVKIEVIDSRSASMGIGLIVLAAAQAVKDGKTFTEIIKIINQLIDKLNVFFLVDTLDFLQKGGRIGKASYLLGSLLSIKPILNISEGEIYGYEKVRGKGKALERLVEISSFKLSKNSKIKCAIVHCDSLDNALKLSDKMVERFNCSEIIVSDVGAVIGTHVGPGTIGLIYYELN